VVSIPLRNAGGRTLPHRADRHELRLLPASVSAEEMRRGSRPACRSRSASWFWTVRSSTSWRSTPTIRSRWLRTSRLRARCGRDWQSSRRSSNSRRRPPTPRPARRERALHRRCGDRGDDGPHADRGAERRHGVLEGQAVSTSSRRRSSRTSPVRSSAAGVRMSASWRHRHGVIATCAWSCAHRRTSRPNCDDARGRRRGARRHVARCLGRLQPEDFTAEVRDGVLRATIGRQRAPGLFAGLVTIELEGAKPSRLSCP